MRNHNLKKSSGLNGANKGQIIYVEVEYSREQRELEQKINEELGKEMPDVNKMKQWRDEIIQLQRQVQNNQNLMQTNFSQLNQLEDAVSPTKNKHSGLNALLYIGSFLIIAGAGSLIIATSTNEMTKCMILLAMVMIFYVGGLMMRNKSILLPAGTALVGTALAITPFLGLAFSNLAYMEWNVAWFFTSVLGVVLYSIATILLNNEVIAYFSLAFAISLVCSVPACLEWSVIWCFVAMMCASIAFSGINILSKKYQLKIFKDPVYFASRWLAVIIALASIMVAPVSETWQYVLIFGLGLLQTGLNWYMTRDKIDEVIVRGFAQTFLPILVFAITDHNLFLTGITISVTTLMHAVWSVFIYEKNPETNKIVECVLTIILLVVSVMALLMVGNGEMIELGHNQFEITKLLTVIWCLLLILFCGWVSRKRKNDNWLYGTMGALAVLPIVVYFAFLNNILLQPTYYYMICYMSLLIGFLIWLKYCSSKERKAMEFLVDFSLIAMILSTLIFCILGISEHEMWFHSILFIGLALAWGLAGKMVRVRAFYEVGFYVCLAFLCRIINEIGGMVDLDGHVWAALIIHTIGLGLCAVGFSESYNKKQDIGAGYVRQLIGIIIISVAMYFLALGASNSYNMGWQLVFLLEEILLLVVGVLRRWKWMWITGAVGTVFAVMGFTRGVAYVWFILIGIGLIALVIYKLAKKNKIENSKNSNFMKLNDSTGVNESENQSSNNDEG